MQNQTQNSLNIDQLLDLLNQDKQYIEERAKERHEQFNQAIQHYKKNILKEDEFIEKTKQAYKQRNNELKDQMINVYMRYNTGSDRIIRAMKKTVIEKIRMNDLLQKAFPKHVQVTCKNVEKRQQSLQQRLEKIKHINRQPSINLYQILKEKYEGLAHLEPIYQHRDNLEKEVVEIRKILIPLESQVKGYENELDVKCRENFKNLYGTQQYTKQKNKDYLQEFQANENIQKTKKNLNQNLVNYTHISQNSFDYKESLLDGFLIKRGGGNIMNNYYNQNEKVIFYDSRENFVARNQTDQYEQRTNQKQNEIVNYPVKTLKKQKFE